MGHTWVHNTAKCGCHSSFVCLMAFFTYRVDYIGEWQPEPNPFSLNPRSVYRTKLNDWLLMHWCHSLLDNDNVSIYVSFLTGAAQANYKETITFIYKLWHQSFSRNYPCFYWVIEEWHFYTLCHLEISLSLVPLTKKPIGFFQKSLITALLKK